MEVEMVKEVIVHKEKDCEDCLHFQYCWLEDTVVSEHFRNHCYGYDQKLWEDKYGREDV